MSEENVGLVRQAYEAWNRGDLEWLLNHITPASEFRTARGFPDVEAAYRGQEGFTQFWNAIREPWETFLIEVERLEPVSDDRVLALFWFHGLGRQGVEVTSKFAQLFTLAEGMVKQQVGFGELRPDSRSRRAAGVGRVTVASREKHAPDPDAAHLRSGRCPRAATGEH